MNQEYGHNHDNSCCGHSHDDHVHHDDHACEDAGHDGLYGQPDEIPAIYSDTINISIEKGITKEALGVLFRGWLEGVRTWAGENNYFIGHIKSFVHSDSGYSLWLSTTGHSVKASEQNTGQNGSITLCTVSVTMIIFGAKTECVRDASMDCLTKAVNSAVNGIRILSENSHFSVSKGE